MRVTMVIKGLHEAPGGAERVFCQLATRLACRHDLRIITFDAPGLPSFYPLADVRRIGLGTDEAGATATAGSFLSRIRRLRRALREERPNVVVAFMHSSFIPTALALAGTGIPLIGSEHTSIVHFARRRVQLSLYRAVLPLINCLTVPSPAARDGFPRQFQRKMAVIPNPLDDTFLDQPADKKVRHHRLVSVGRFDAAKGHPAVVEAFAALAPRFPDWTLHIYGDGPLRPALMEEVERRGLAERVRMPGVVTDIAPKLSAASLFVLASRYESYGLAVAEAMACGLPAIVPQTCPALCELVEDGVSGMIVPSAQPPALAEGLARLMGDADSRRRMGDNAQAQAKRGMCLERVTAQWEELLDSTARQIGR